MVCCGKRTKPNNKKLLEEDIISFKDNLKHVNKMKNVIPKNLNDKLLLKYHRKTYMLYLDNIKRRPINKAFVNASVDLHNKFIKEMLRRKLNHNTPLSKI